MLPKRKIMNWKFVFNEKAFKNYIEASIAAGKARYKFFLYNDTVYFRDEISLYVFDTGLKEKDLIG